MDMKNCAESSGVRAFRLTLITMMLLMAIVPAKCRVRLPSMIAPGMVVQRGGPIKLWGEAAPGESVTARIRKADEKAAAEALTVADHRGRWTLELPPVEAGGPYVITVNDIDIDNVLCGDVYLCSGQSNMELPVRRVTDMFADEIADYSNNEIREFRVPAKYEFHTPVENLEGGEWKTATPENVMNFSALGYFFAKELYSRTGVPVGIINSSWGGTPIEAWMSEDALREVSPRSVNEKRIYEDDTYRAHIKKLESENFKRWGTALYSADPGIIADVRWHDPRFDDSDWEDVDILQDKGWSTYGVNPINGSHWFRKHVILTANQVKHPAVLRLGCIVDADSVYINGRFAGTTSYQYPPRVYNIPAESLKEGENIITVRLISQRGPGRFIEEKPYKLITANGEISLEGKWKYHIGAQMPAAPGMEFFHYKPAVLYNSMIHPLAKVDIAGTVWYQGESNVERRNEYGPLLRAMIKDWRELFNKPDMPFYIVELANFLHPSDTAGREAWAEMRATQAEAAHDTPCVTLIRNYDLGEWNDIHPLDKKTLGKRLADEVTGRQYDGGNLWLPEESVINRDIAECGINTPTARIAISELNHHWRGAERISLKIIDNATLGRDGYILKHAPGGVAVHAATDLGLLYGAYHLLRNQSVGKSLGAELRETPAYDLRMLNHWDNLNGTVERGYAGGSIWKWDELPDSISERYQEYARANASMGINAVVLNNVNASSRILTEEYLKKVASLADVFRPYGIRVFLSANFSAPMQLDSLPSADPLDNRVADWWWEKCREIFRLIPDFGGFLVKANSEGQPGPCDYGRTHAEGANMLARALKPHGGKVIWRAFVYSPSDEDRAKQAFLEFEPLDGQFDDNVIIQIKNGPIDFQPREPFSPLFGAMPATKRMAEFQITQEYLGQGNHIAFLADTWREFFSHVAPSSLSAVAGVANIGDNANWTGHPMAQANWYAFGRMAWNPELTTEEIAREWLRQTICAAGSMPGKIEDNLVNMMLGSREAVVDYMMPLGLHHLFAFGHHYGPEPWCEREGARPDWLPSYYHRADSLGIGFDRTAGGSDAVSQYPAGYAEMYNDVDSCPENLLLWFHHVGWDHKMKSGRTLWEELCLRYERGCAAVADMQKSWESAKPYINPVLYADVAARLITQAKDAEWWKEACLLYFHQFSKMEWPIEMTPPSHDLEYYKNVNLGISNFESPSPALLNSKR